MTKLSQEWQHSQKRSINTEKDLPISSTNLQPLWRLNRRADWRETFFMKVCKVTKHLNNQAGNLLPLHSYIMLPGPHTLHPFLIFSLRHFTTNTDNKLSSIHTTLDEAATLRLICNLTPESNSEEEVTNFLLVNQNNKSTTNQPKIPSASAMTQNNDIN